MEDSCALRVGLWKISRLPYSAARKRSGKMTLNDAVSDNILNFDGAEFRISIVKNGNMVEDYTGSMGWNIDLAEACEVLLDDSGIITGLVDKDMRPEDLRNMVKLIVKALEDFDFDALDKYSPYAIDDVDGTTYQFYVDIFNVSFGF